MKVSKIALLSLAAWCGVFVSTSQAQQRCEDLKDLKFSGVEIASAVPIRSGGTVPSSFPKYMGHLPAHCLVQGVINPRKGIDGQEYGIGFAVALPESSAWNGDLMMQGGGGGDGVLYYPAGDSYAGDRPALNRGFAVVSTDSGHRSKHGAFDFSFMRDQLAYLDFAYRANAAVAALAKRIVAAYYAKPAAYSYFVGCSTGGREGMILSQRFPTVFNGIVVGDPAMRTGLSNLAIGQWIPVAYNQASPKDTSGKPEIANFLTDAQRALFLHSLLKKCDALDGLKDGMIFDPLGCHFDPSVLSCKQGQTTACIEPDKIAAIKKAFAGPKNSYGTQVYPGFFYDTGITMKGFVPGLLNMSSRGIFGPYTTATTIDVDKLALHASDPLVEPASTNLNTFSSDGGKLIFFHGDSDPWFSPLDTLRYYKEMTAANGGPQKVRQWSRLFLVPGMAHCGGGPSLDHFDMLSAVVNWVQKGTAPASVIATGKSYPGRSRPLCAYPEHAQYTGHGDSDDARNFRCE